MLHWKIDSIRLDLKYTWKLSRNATDYKINNIISVGDGRFLGKGEVAPNIRYQETPELMLTEFERFLQASPENITSIQELSEVLESLNLPNALRFGIESAYIHFHCALHNISVCEFLGVKHPLAVATSFSLPIMPIEEIGSFYKTYKLERFKRLKLKVNADSAHDLLKALSSVSNQALIVDANEAWRDPEELLMFLESLTHYPIDIIEQPMPAGFVSEYQHVKKYSPFPLFADESVCEDANFEELVTQFHGLNMKLMKAGGYLNGLRLLNEARKHQMQTMVGCMVETTLGISSAMNLCDGVNYVDLDGFMIIKGESFGMVREEEGILKV
jgi:L-Ala-D/L-Glu epimerase